MPTLYVRDVPDRVTAALKRKAADEGKSLSAYLTAELTVLAERPSRREIQKRLAAVDRTSAPSSAETLAELQQCRRS